MDGRDLIDAIGVRTAEDEAMVYIAVDGADEGHGDAVGGGRRVAGLEAVEAALRRDAVLGEGFDEGVKVWHSTDKYHRTIYRCNGKFKSHCKTPHLTEDDTKEAFVRAANRLIENKAEILNSITLLKERLTDTEAMEEERNSLSTDLNLLADKVQQLIAENARVAQNQDDYDRNYNELVSRYEAAKTQYDKTCEAIQYRKARSRQMDSFIKELRNQDLIKEFDARLWGSLVDFITVYSKDDIRVTFKDGTEIRA